MPSLVEAYCSVDKHRQFEVIPIYGLSDPRHGDEQSFPPMSRSSITQSIVTISLTCVLIYKILTRIVNKNGRAHLGGVELAKFVNRRNVLIEELV